METRSKPDETPGGISRRSVLAALGHLGIGSLLAGCAVPRGEAAWRLSGEGMNFLFEQFHLRGKFRR